LRHAVCASLVNARASQILATSREPLGVGGRAARRVRRCSAKPMRPRSTELRHYAGGQAFVPACSRRCPLRTDEDNRNKRSGLHLARLDGPIPLALELAAARARAVSLGVIADRLRTPIHLLKWQPTPVPRQQTLAATIA